MGTKATATQIGLPLAAKIEFLMHPIRRSTVLEKINDSDIPMKPVKAVSVDDQICAAEATADGELEGS